MAEIEFRVGGQVIIVPAEDRETVLDCALRNAVNAPYSCLEGVCSTCQAVIREGQVENPGAGQDCDVALSKQEPVLTCQVRIKKGCERLVVDYDAR